MSSTSPDDGASSTSSEGSPPHPTAEADGAASCTTLRGSLRPLPAAAGVRLAQGVLGLLFVRSLVRGFAALALGYRQTATLTLGDGELRLLTEKRLFGRGWGGSERHLSLPHISEISLEVQGEDPRLTAGLVALGLGSFIGIYVLSQGLSSAGTSPSLMAYGALIFALGFAFDYLLGSGRSAQDPVGPAQLVVQAAGERGWVLGKLKRSEARGFVESLQAALRSHRASAE